MAPSGLCLLFSPRAGILSREGPLATVPEKGSVKVREVREQRSSRSHYSSVRLFGFSALEKGRCRSRTTAVPCAPCARGLRVPRRGSDLEPGRLPEEEVVKESVVLDQQVKYPIQ